MKTTKLYKEILEAIELAGLDFSEQIDEVDFYKICEQPENSAGLSFGIYQRLSDMDSWLEAHYYSEKLRKTIIWKHDYQDEYEDAEDLAESLYNTEMEITEFERLLPDLSNI